MSLTKTASPGWVEISIEGPVFILEALADFFNSLGAGGVIFSQAQSKKAGYERMTGFLAQNKKLPAQMAKLRKYLAELSRLFPEHPLAEPKIQTIIDQDWLNQWRESVVPTQVSKKFWVVPEWQEPPPEALKPGYFVIRMEPGLAFGTGYHPTTQLCLEIVEEFVPEKGTKVLDVGTGTGILAIASAMLGAEKVFALEIEELSLEVARDNFQRNQLQDKIRLLRAGPKTYQKLVRIKFDLILANLHLAELKKIAQELTRLLQSGGYLAMSGILPDQASELIAVYKKLGMSMVQKKEKDRWLLILMKKN